MHGHLNIKYVPCDLLRKPVFCNYTINIKPEYVPTITQFTNVSLPKYLETCNPAVYTVTTPMTKKNKIDESVKKISPCGDHLHTSSFT